MPHFYDSFPQKLQDWSLEQPIFFVASAPLQGKHVNLSPKGRPSACFAIFDEHHAAYLDFTGSGAETISHIYENGRVTVMFCSFDNSPRIMRLFCTGRVVEWDMPEFEPTIARMGKENVTGTRAVVLLDIWKVQTSCGYAVPIIRPHQPTLTAAHASEEIEKTGELTAPPCKCFEERYTLEKWLVHKVNKKALGDYQAKLNSRSLDGLLGLRAARKINHEWLLMHDAASWFSKTMWYPYAISIGILIGFFVGLLVSAANITDPVTIRMPTFNISIPQFPLRVASEL